MDHIDDSTSYRYTLI